MSLFFWLFFIQLPGVSLRKFWFLLLHNSDASSSLLRSVSQFLSPLISSATYLANYCRSLKHESTNQHNLTRASYSTLPGPFLVSLLGFYLVCSELLEGLFKKKILLNFQGWYAFLFSLQGYLYLSLILPAFFLLCTFIMFHWYYTVWKLILYPQENYKHYQDKN